MARRRARRRPLAGEGSDRLGSNFDRGLSAGDPDEVINLNVNVGLLGGYMAELEALALEYRQNVERGHLQVRGMVSHYLGLPGLRALWPMSSVDEDGKAHDLSGQGRVLTGHGSLVYGATADRFPASVRFGVSNPDRYLSRGDEDGLNWDGLESYMVLAWVRPQWGAPVGYAPVVSKGDVDTGHEYSVLVDEDSLRLRVAAGNRSYLAPVSAALQKGRDVSWNFVAAGYDGAEDEFVAMVNGWYGRVDGDSPTLAATGDDFYVGRHDDGLVVRRWRGELAMVGLYSGVLSEEHLRNVYEGTRFAFE